MRAAIYARYSSDLQSAASIDDQIRDDFESGRITVVDGWLLSVTEARQAALFSLTPA